jgi:hypothetical protein
MGRKDYERAPNSPRLTTTPMLDAERKAVLSAEGEKYAE